MNILKIKQIKKISPPSLRYDLTIEKYHNYFANDILVHNSNWRAGYVKTQTNTLWKKKSIYWASVRKLGLKLILKD